jgi:hypothetical protein
MDKNIEGDPAKLRRIKLEFENQKYLTWEATGDNYQMLQITFSDSVKRVEGRELLQLEEMVPAAIKNGIYERICLYCFIVFNYIRILLIWSTWKVLKCGAGEEWRRSVGPIM